MKTSILTVLALSFTSSALAQSTSPQCVRTCGSSNPTSSWCDGDETGTALSNCTCQTLQYSDLLQCIKKSCSESDLATYASNLPQPCGSSLFPGLATGGTGGAGGSSSSGAAAPTTTATTAAGTTVPTGTDEASSTSTTSRPTTTAPPSAGSGIFPPGLVLAALPLAAALL